MILTVLLLNASAIFLTLNFLLLVSQDRLNRIQNTLLENAAPLNASFSSLNREIWSGPYYPCCLAGNSGKIQHSTFDRRAYKNLRVVPCGFHIFYLKGL